MTDVQSPASTTGKEKKRGVLLTIILVLMLLGSIYSIAANLLFKTAIEAFLPDLPAWMFSVYAIGGVLNFILTIALFSWKKWAFWGLCATSAILFVLNLVLGFGLTLAITGVVGVGILYLVLRPKWALLE